MKDHKPPEPIAALRVTTWDRKYPRPYEVRDARDEDSPWIPVSLRRLIALAGLKTARRLEAGETDQVFSLDCQKILRRKNDETSTTG